MPLTAPEYLVVDRLAVEVHPDRLTAGRAAAHAVAAGLRDVIADRGEARVVFACAPSQDEFLAELIKISQSECPVDWRRVSAFHMDEYVGLSAEHPQAFRTYLRHHLLDHVAVKAFHPIQAEDPASALALYSKQLIEKPIDLICLGVGENGHIAFNDPPVANFADTALIKQVELDSACRNQQVNDGCFESLHDVPRHALTLTIPVFRQARRLVVVVSGARKANAVAAMLHGKITPNCPASILRVHPAATLYLDAAAAAHPQPI